MRQLACLLFIILFTYPLSAQETFKDEAGVSYVVEPFRVANFPVGMVFTEDGRLFYNEKITGNMRLVHANGTLQPEPVITLPTDALQERGMLGIALAPDYENNGFIWVVHTAQGTTRDFPANNVVRFREEDGIGHDPEIMLSIPIDNGKLLHNGGNIHFDAEGLLYVSFGDYGDAENAQELQNPRGKIHRFAVTDEELVPAEGNLSGSSVYGYGFRNPFDFTFDPIGGNLFATENGLHCDDEINLVINGFNYGWSETYECVGTDLIAGLSLYSPPLLSYTPTIAPTGIVFYDHPAIPEWQGDLFFCSWNFGTLYRAELNDGRNAVTTVHEMDLGGVQCRLDIVVSPNGDLYFGTVGEDGGAIYRIRPDNSD